MNSAHMKRYIFTNGPPSQDIQGSAKIFAPRELVREPIRLLAHYEGLIVRILEQSAFALHLRRRSFRLHPCAVRRAHDARDAPAWVSQTSEVGVVGWHS